MAQFATSKELYKKAWRLADMLSLSFSLPEPKLKVSFCDCSMSVVPRASSDVLLSTIYLKDISSLTSE